MLIHQLPVHHHDTKLRNNETHSCSQRSFLVLYATFPSDFPQTKLWMTCFKKSTRYLLISIPANTATVAFPTGSGMTWRRRMCSMPFFRSSKLNYNVPDNPIICEWHLQQTGDAKHSPWIVHRRAISKGRDIIPPYRTTRSGGVDYGSRVLRTFYQ